MECNWIELCFYEKWIPKLFDRGFPTCTFSRFGFTCWLVVVEDSFRTDWLIVCRSSIKGLKEGQNWNEIVEELTLLFLCEWERGWKCDWKKKGKLYHVAMCSSIEMRDIMDGGGEEKGIQRRTVFGLLLTDVDDELDEMGEILTRRSSAPVAEAQQGFSCVIEGTPPSWRLLPLTMRDVFLRHYEPVSCSTVSFLFRGMEVCANGFGISLFPPRLVNANSETVIRSEIEWSTLNSLVCGELR